MTTVSTTIANMMTGSDGDFADRRGPGDRKKYTVSGPVRRGRPLTGGQLPYKGSLVRPAVRFHHSLFEYNGRLLRATNHEPRTTIFHEPRVTRGDVVNLNLLPISGI